MPLNGDQPRKGSLDQWFANAKKEICKCCRKDLGLFVGNIAMFRGKCQVCRQKICSTCVSNNLCHKCRIKHTWNMTPENLMQLPGKKLLEMASMLHFHNPQGYEKSELVQLILAIYGVKWTRPIPEAPSSTCSPNTSKKVNGEKCRNCEQEIAAGDVHETFCRKCDVLVKNNYQPEALMQLSGKELQDVLGVLQVPKIDVCALEKGELVMLILKTVGIFEDWKPPVPQEPSSRPRSADDSSATVITSPAHVPDNENATTGNIEVSEAYLQSSRPQVPDNVNVASGTRPSLNLNGADQNPNSTVADRRPSWNHIRHLDDIPSADVIQELKGAQLKLILQEYGIDIEGCCEKKELADKVYSLWTTSRTGGNYHTSENNQRQEQHTTEGERGSHSGVAANGNDNSKSTDKKTSSTFIILPGEVPCLRTITSEKDIELLSNRQLMAILQKHSVDYSLCKERTELIQRVIPLWNEASKWNSSDDIPDEDVCKICMDAPIDCVLLECGHMVACTECGRQMSECPICRQYVVRVVHTFKT